MPSRSGRERELGRTTEGIALIRQGMAGELEIGHAHNHPLNYGTYLAESAGTPEGAIDDALETIEQTLRAYPDELLNYRPESAQVTRRIAVQAGAD